MRSARPRRPLPRSRRLRFPPVDTLKTSARCGCISELSTVGSSCLPTPICIPVILPERHPLTTLKRADAEHETSAETMAGTCRGGVEVAIPVPHGARSATFRVAGEVHRPHHRPRGQGHDDLHPGKLTLPMAPFSGCGSVRVSPATTRAPAAPLDIGPV